MNFTCNKTEMAELVAALRSGEYKSGRYALRRNDDTFCCLGVYCDLRVRKGLGQWVLDGGGERYTYVDEASGRSDTILTEAASNALGLPYSESDTDFVDYAPDINLSGDKCDSTAVGMNDAGRSFHAIADALERDYLSQ